jgi:hypothetical protein
MGYYYEEMYMDLVGNNINYLAQDLTDLMP